MCHVTLDQLQSDETHAFKAKADEEWDAMVELGSHKLSRLAKGSREAGLMYIKIAKTKVMPVEAAPAEVSRITELEMLQYSLSGKHRCEGCDRGFNNIAALRKHQAIRKKPTGKEYSWCPDPIIKGDWAYKSVCDRTETLRGDYYRVVRTAKDKRTELPHLWMHAQ